MRIQPFLLLLLLCGFFNVASGQTSSCWAQADCKQQALAYAVRITGLVNYLGTCSEDTEANKTNLKNLETNNPAVYRDFMETAKAIADQYIDHPRYTDSRLCFFESLPTTSASNVMAWINFTRDKTPTFPSTEFCGGLSRRFEIGQGAAAFLSKPYMQYLGAVKAYLVYTFHNQKTCGGRFRLMAGPAFYLRSATSYTALSSRLGIRLKDFKANVFSLGNINFFGGYTSNLDHFNYAEAGLELELGAIGVNLAAQYDTDIRRTGFLVGLVLANKKFKK